MVDCGRLGPCSRHQGRDPCSPRVNRSSCHLVDEAGKRTQGLLAKLGITQSYAIINTFLYSVYGSINATAAKNADLIAYRNSWLDALTKSNKIEAVIALGSSADAAWKTWSKTTTGKTFSGAYAHVTHPTQPESSSSVPAKIATATQALLVNWNAGLAVLSPALKHPDAPTPLIPYGTTWGANDRPEIPEADMPAGLPAWMHQQDQWATRVGTALAARRANITITVPAGVIP